ncbi:hypothetical protein ACQV2T_08385 [Facklamia sp. P13069]|uniref:hypothetical protein n=1 Tax=Facklamia sp. P13069 TaxID=3421954 RepID=UPI003D169952
MLNKEIMKNTLFDTLVEASKSGVINVGQTLVENIGMDATKEIAANVAIETGVNFLPIIGSAYQSYKINKRLERQDKFIKLLQSRLDSFINRVHQSLEEKQKYSELLDFSLESVGLYSQEEKISYLANGLITMFNTDNISFDIGYLYINTLNQITLLDIEVLKFYLGIQQVEYYQKNNRRTYQDILDKFKIEYYQYEAVRDNLYRLGLLRKRTERNQSKDLKNIEENLEILDSNVKSIFKYISNIDKRTNKLSSYKKINVKFETKDNLEISKFGNEFVKYFCEEL